ncbi:MAG: putative Ig domain-containing protein [Luteolibacter sp.]
MSGNVSALALDFGGRLYAGGSFNTAGSKVSRFVAKAVNLLDELPPFLSLQPSNLSILEGDEAILSARASGIPPFSWQWYRGQSGDTSSPVGANSKSFPTGSLLANTSFWVRVTNPFGSTASQTATVTTQPRLPIFSGPASYTGDSGQLFSAQVQATLGPLTYSATNLPNGLAMDASTGWITGTPTASGSWSAQITAANYLRAATTTITFTITPPKPVITSADVASGRVNDPFSHQITATQNPTTYGAANLPSGLSVNPATGLISGTPLVYGIFAVAVTAVNGGGTGQQALSLTILPPIPPPVITSPLFAAATANIAFSYQIAASNSPQSFAIQNGPAWLSVNTATGLLSGTPVIPGNVTVQVRATNTTGPGEWTSLSISIAPHPNAPAITSLAEARGRKNDSFSFQLTASPAAASYVISGSLPAGVTLIASSGLLSGTPSVEGTFNVTITASNASGQSVATPLKIVLGPPRLVPGISSVASLLANVGVNFTTTVLASNSPTSFTFENLPAGLLQNGTTGQISGTPSTPGTFNFSVKATNADGTGLAQPMVLRVQYHPDAPNVLPFASSSVATASAVAGAANPLDFPSGLPVIPILPPVIVAPPAVGPPGPSGYVGVAFSYQTQVDKAATQFTATALPGGLSISAATGFIGGTPTAPGFFEVTLQASNLAGLGEPRVMTFKIDAKPDTPEIVGSLNLETAALAPFTYTVQTTSILPITSYGISGLPDGLVANFQTGQISGAATVTGTFQVKLRASSAVGAGSESTLYLLVRAGPLVPKVTSFASVEIQQGSALNYQITATNPPIKGYQVSSLPDGLALNATTGIISGKPVNPGIYQVILRASNVNGASDPLTLQIIVKPNPAVPVMLIPTYIYVDTTNPISITLTATNLPSSSPWESGIGIFAESLPSGMTLNAATGILSGTPVFSNGKASSTVYGRNSSGRGTSVAMVIYDASIGKIPTINGPLQLSATWGNSLSFTTTTSRLAGSYIGYGLLFDNFDRSQTTSTFTVPSGSLPLPGRTNYTLWAYFSGAYYSGQGVRAGLPLTVAPASGAPAIQNPQVIYSTAGTPVSANLAASGNPTRFEVTAMSPAWPSGLVFAPSTGAFSGTVSQSGVISFLARAYNATSPGLTKEITMVFSPPSGAPAITSGGTQLLSLPRSLLLANGETSLTLQPNALALTLPPLSGKVGVALTHQFQATANVIRYRISGLPEGLVYNENTGNILGTPSKPGSFTITVTPIGQTVSGQAVQVSLVIDPADGTPVMTSPITASVVSGTPFTFQFSATPSPSGYNVPELPEWLVFNPFTGVLSGTPSGPGDSKIDVSAFNALGQGRSQLLIIHSAAAPGTPVMIPPLSLFSGRVGVPLTASISAMSSVDFFDATALPFGISLNPQTGVFSGSPVESGSFKVNVWGVNTQGTGEAVAVTFVIQPAVGTPSFSGETIIRKVAGISFTQTFSTSPSASLYAADGMPSGWTFGTGTGQLQATPLAGTYNLALESWNAVGSSGRKAFQIRVFDDQGGLWKDQAFGEQANDATISGWGADPDHDGMANLIERAFNLPPLVPGSPVVAAGTGTYGLPLLSTVGTGNATRLRMEYLRLKASANPGLIYTPQFSSGLGSTWQSAPGLETVQSINTDWERVTIEDNTIGETKRFGRIRVSN